MTRIRRTDEEWSEIIQKCRTSGFADREWCESHGISINTFYNKIAQLRKKACEVPVSELQPVHSAPEIVPLTISDDYTSTVPLKNPSDASVIINVNGCVVELHNHASRELIQNTIWALRQL